MKKSLKFCLLPVWIPIMMVLISCLSCSRKIYVPVETHSMRVDTLRYYRMAKDTVYVSDSVREYHRGDTVFLKRIRTEYRERWRHDTFIHMVRDTVYIEKCIVAEARNRVGANRKIKKWILGALVIIILGLCIKFRNRK